MCKNYCIFCIIFILSVQLCYCDNDEFISDIRKQFQEWQEILNDSCKFEEDKYYHIFYGENLENEKWITKYPENSEIFISEELVLLECDLGTMLKLARTSPSGDWVINAEHYFWPTGELFFVFWSMNTYLADEPMTIEKRFYFDKDGEKIKIINYAFKMNTNSKIIEPNFYDIEVQYWLSVNKLPFLQNTP